MIKKILLGLGLIIAAIAAAAAVQPSHFHVERSIVVDAPAANVFAELNDLHHWEAWSPWAKLDPNATSSYEGPESGVGAIMRWDGNMDVGKGSMTITESAQDERVKLRLDFEKPMAGTNTSEFRLTPSGTGTMVNWSIEGENHFIAKVMSLFMNCDEMIGGYFEQGLQNLKQVAQGNQYVIQPKEN